MDKEQQELNRYHIWQAMQIGGTYNCRKPSDKDVARMNARRRLEDMQMAKDLGIDLEELQ